MQFDPSKGFGEVHGIAGVRYEQSGHLFAHNGAEVRIVTLDGNEIAEVIGKPLSVPVAELIAVPETKSEGGGLRDRHWREIKALVEANEGVWTNKQDGINFLEGRS